METYYHYTNPQAARAIMQSRVIRKSVQKVKDRRDDARYGSGVYLTDCHPSAPIIWIAWNCFDDGMAALAKKIKEGEFQCYIYRPTRIHH